MRSREWGVGLKTGVRAYHTSQKDDNETHNEEKSLVLVILMNFAKERLKVSADRCVSVYIAGMLYLHGEGIRKEMKMKKQIIIEGE